MLIRRGPRVALLGMLILAIFAVYGLRLWNLQFVQGETYRARADQQRLRIVDIFAPRGLVYDRNGAPLVHNVPSFNVVVVPAYLPEEPEEEEAVLTRLATLLDVPYATAEVGEDQGGDEPPAGVRELVDGVDYAARYSPLAIERGVERDTALLVAQEAMALPGVFVQIERQRDYVYGPLVSQLLGYLLPVPGEEEERYIELGYDPATDRVGAAGVEATYEDLLRGSKGRHLIEEDVLGREIRVVAEQAQPVPGNSVYLSLDVELQQFAEDALRRSMERDIVDSSRGVVIVMNPQTGEILAMVSLPTYDNNLFAEGISARDLQRLSEDPHRPMLNHAISDLLPPGSIFKVVVATGALQDAVITPRTQFNCAGTMVIPDKFAPDDASRAQPFYCWNRGGHGWLDLVGGIAHSCDIFFYKVGGGFQEVNFEGLGVERIAHYAELFGLGEPTGVELPADFGGLVPTADWKRLTYSESWTTGDTYILSIGQGFLLVTPLAMLNVFNAVANGGNLYRPRIVHHVANAEGEVVEPFEPGLIRALPVEAEHLAVVRQGMEGAVLYGTAPKAQIEGVRVAGKTGTAQYCDDIAIDLGICGEGLQMPEHAWFAAFAPVDDPQVSVIVFVYGGGEGTVAGVPVAHDILRYYFGLYEDTEGAPGEASGAAVDEGLADEGLADEAAADSGADQANDTDAGSP